MLNIFLNVTNAKELATCLDMLQTRGLLPNGNVVPIKSNAPAPASAGGRGSYMKLLGEKSDARLAELGLTDAPKALPRELVLRGEINSERKTANEKGIAWNVDLCEREKALLSKGYDIFNPPADAASEGEESNLNFDHITDDVPL